MPKLLLADDSVTIQRVIELTFADEQIQVIAVGDGQQAIFEIEQHRPDIVLADVGMPQRDGYEVAAFVKRTPYLSHIPVLLLTGAFEPIDEARARAVGCDGVLAKPFEPQMVINRVKDLLAGRRPASLWSDASAPAPAPAAVPAEPAAPVHEEPKAVDSLDEYFDRLDAAFSKAAPPPRDAQAEKAREPEPLRTAGSLAVDFGDWDLPGSPGTPAKPAFAQSAAPDKPAVTPAPAERSAFAQSAAPDKPAVAQGAAAEKPVPATYQPAVASRVEAPAPGRVEQLAPELPPSLADAFAALLAAEQGLAAPQAAASRLEPVQPARVAAPAVTDEVIEDIVGRVIARLTDQTVRETVLSTAERLVREEIERVKKGAP
ncbi:MAG TPA: response regulator [Vicinamibacterales bacterium]|jgi:CheY-like chemotaxis protein|nr:response regulator [Vicinamibacterales bacterium]